MSGWIGVDLDGTLAVHVSGQSVLVIGKPVHEMVARVQSWIDQGRDVRIFTARVAATGIYSAEQNLRDDQAFADGQRQLISEWCLEHIGKVLPITATKDFQLTELWDDRAIGVISNTGLRR